MAAKAEPSASSSAEQPALSGQPGGSTDKTDSVEQPGGPTIGYVHCLEDARNCDDPKIRQEIFELLEDMIDFDTSAIGVTFPRLHGSAQKDSAEQPASSPTQDLFRAIKEVVTDKGYNYAMYAGEVMWFARTMPANSCVQNFDETGACTVARIGMSARHAITTMSLPSMACRALERVL